MLQGLPILHLSFFFHGLHRLVTEGSTRASLSGITLQDWVTYGTLVRLYCYCDYGIALYFAGVKGAYVGAGAMSLAVLLKQLQQG